jgi:hypothetical protein
MWKMREETDMSETKKITGYPSIDKPWMKYYPEESENQPISNNTLYQNVLIHNQKNMNQFALEYYGNRVTYSRHHIQLVGSYWRVRRRYCFSSSSWFN